MYKVNVILGSLLVAAAIGSTPVTAAELGNGNSANAGGATSNPQKPSRHQKREYLRQLDAERKAEAVQKKAH